jgi:hypothetical protein
MGNAPTWKGVSLLAGAGDESHLLSYNEPAAILWLEVIMNTRISRIRLYLRAFIVLTLFSTGCSGNTPTDVVPTPNSAISSASPVSSTAAGSPEFVPISTETALPSGWSDFINGYYGYAISLPPNAEVSKAEVEAIPESAASMTIEELQRMYPPGGCVSIDYQSVYFLIRVADYLGGQFHPVCGRSGIGAVHPVWTEEEVVVGDVSFLATYGRMYESDAPDAKFLEEFYTIDMGDGAAISFGSVAGGWPDQAAYDQYLIDKETVLEILRTYRSVPKEELYCPQPAPTRLQVGGFASVNTDPPLTPNNVRSAPGINQDLIGSINPGQGMELLEGPVCNNSLQWWRVEVFETGLVGWTPEGDQETFWLIACESRENCGTP